MTLKPDAHAQLAEREKELEAARARVEELTAELDATNRGIIALHSELESAREAEARARAEREVVAERDRIARDLHDLVIQRVFGASMELQGIAGRIQQSPLAGRVKLVIRDLDTTIAELRTAIFGLHDQPQQASSLRAQLADIATQAGEGLAHAPGIGFEGPIDAAVPDHTATDLLAITRTALSNITRRSDSTRTDILVRAIDELLLQIDNDGTGLSETTRISGVGDIAGRTAALGGTFQITSAQETGVTRLEWRVPLAQGHHDD